MMDGFDLLELLRTLFEHWWSEFTDIGEWPYGTFDSIAEYIDLFPLVVCLLWCLYGVNSLIRSFRKQRVPAHLPGYTVLIPFFAEPDGAVRTAHSLDRAHPAPDQPSPQPCHRDLSPA